MPLPPLFPNFFYHVLISYSWDRYVREEFILPFTEENRQLQTKLAEEAALSL